MSLHSVYSQGIKDSTNNTYNLLVSGGSDYPNSSGIILGNSTISGASTNIYKDNSSNNAYIDFSSNSSSSITMRHTSNGSTFNNMLSLMNDDKSSSSVKAVTVNGRMSSSQIIASEDSRIPSHKGLYMSQSNGTAKFSSAGNGGFVLSNYYSNGTLNNNVLVLNPNGSISTPYYKQTTNVSDNETCALVTIDENGKLARGWNMNKRIRDSESNVQSVYNVLNSGLPNTINSIINRVNALSFANPNVNNVPLISSTEPGAPNIGTVTVTNPTKVSIPFTPGLNGGEIIQSYVVNSTPNISLTVSGGPTSPLTVTGIFIAGISYSFKIAAVNLVGTGTYSLSSNSVTPYPSFPGPSTIETITVIDNKNISIHFTPGQTGGGPITRYIVTSTPSIVLNLSNVGSPLLVNGNFFPGTSYKFKIAGINSFGTGTYSSDSNSVTPYPYTVPRAPIISPVTIINTTNVSIGIDTRELYGELPVTSCIVTSTPSITPLNVSAIIASKITVTGNFVVVTSYTFQVASVNSLGNGQYSSISNSVIPNKTVPGVSTIATVTFTNTTTVLIPFTPPSSDGGSPITRYSVTSTPAVTLTVSNGTTSPLTVTGNFTYGTSYTFKIAAVNSIGTALYSSDSNSVIPKPYTVPGVSTISFITVRSTTKVDISILVGSSGGQPITNFYVICSPAITINVLLPINVSYTDGLSTTISVIGNFEYGTSYTFKIAGINSIGTSSYSSYSDSIIPKPYTIPSISTISTINVINPSTVSIMFTPPESDGGLPITSYIATCTPTINLTVSTGTTSPLTVTGMFVAGISYAFQIAARNSIIGEIPSLLSDSLIPNPIIIPGAPTISTVTVINKTTISIPFTSGTTGGLPITSYIATCTPEINLIVSTGTTSPLTVTGNFINSTAYSFQIAAVNSTATGPYSSVSNYVTPWIPDTSTWSEVNEPLVPGNSYSLFNSGGDIQYYIPQPLTTTSFNNGSDTNLMKTISFNNGEQYGMLYSNTSVTFVSSPTETFRLLFQHPGDPIGSLGDFNGYSFDETTYPNRLSQYLKLYAGVCPPTKKSVIKYSIMKSIYNSNITINTVGVIVKFNFPEITQNTLTNLGISTNITNNQYDISNNITNNQYDYNAIEFKFVDSSNINNIIYTNFDKSNLVDHIYSNSEFPYAPNQYFLYDSEKRVVPGGTYNLYVSILKVNPNRGILNNQPGYYDQPYYKISSETPSVVIFPVDCIVSEWSEYMTCNTLCGDGTQTRSRTVVIAGGDGIRCPILTETQPCNVPQELCQVYNTIRGEYAQFDVTTPTIITKYYAFSNSSSSFPIYSWALVGSNNINGPYNYLVYFPENGFWSDYIYINTKQIIAYKYYRLIFLKFGGMYLLPQIFWILDSSNSYINATNITLSPTFPTGGTNGFFINEYSQNNYPIFPTYGPSGDIGSYGKDIYIYIGETETNVIPHKIYGEYIQIDMGPEPHMTSYLLFSNDSPTTISNWQFVGSDNSIGPYNLIESNNNPNMIQFYPPGKRNGVLLYERDIYNWPDEEFYAANYILNTPYRYIRIIFLNFTDGILNLGNVQILENISYYYGATTTLSPSFPSDNNGDKVFYLNSHEFYGVYLKYTNCPTYQLNGTYIGNSFTYISNLTIQSPPKISNIIFTNSNTVSIMFIPSISDLRVPITSYSVICEPWAQIYTISGTTSPLTVTGAFHDELFDYKFQIAAVNSLGTGLYSIAVETSTVTVPGAPTIGTATVTNSTTVSIPFTSGSNGGETINKYFVMPSPHIPLSVSGTTSPLTVTASFVAGISYTFYIQAVNSVGTGWASSYSNSVTPYT